MIDDDLQGMLEELELDSETEEPTKLEPDVEPVKPVVADPVPKPILDDPPPPPVLAPVPPTDLFDTESEPDELFDIRDFIKQHERDYGDAKGNIYRDRAKADEVVRILMQRVEDGGASNQETESLVQAVKLLIDSNGHLVRLLDSKSKLLTASRGGMKTLIQQNFGRNENTDLEDLLSQTVDEDEA
jgi:hypothetical protein